MAAGMGSRYGGLKQIDPVDDKGHIIMDFSIYDARRAGFEEVIFIIKKENEQLFREAIGDRISRTMKVHYVFQEAGDLPEGFTVPEGRVKPWGTGHAVLSARDVIQGPFAVINADDYYGPEAFRLIYDFLTVSNSCTEEAGDRNQGALEERQQEDSERQQRGSCAEQQQKAFTEQQMDACATQQKDACTGQPQEYVMAGYLLKNTLTDHGSVARGVCSTDDSGNLLSIVERTKIIRTKDGAAYTEDDGKTWIPVSADSVVSMNMWGFPESFLEELKERFPVFLKKELAENPMKCEFYLPFAVNDVMEEGKARVKVLTVHDVWHGVTYAEDKQEVVDAMRELKDAGVYADF